MITRFQVQNYKALRDVTLDLTPIHVLIGPNNSGKTSILDAIASLCWSVDHKPSQAFVGSWQGADLVWKGEIDRLVAFEAGGKVGEKSWQYRFACRFAQKGQDVQVEDRYFTFGPVSTGGAPDSAGESGLRRTFEGMTTDERQSAEREFSEALAGVHLYRWVPRLLSLPVAAQSQHQFQMGPTGFGLALCLDDILGYDRRRFDELESHFKRIFPEVDSIILMRGEAFTEPMDESEQIPRRTKTSRRTKASGKGLYFRFKENKQQVPAAQVSDGMLLVLAYLTLSYLPHPPRVLLIEEPENGIHPKRLQEILQILRKLIAEQGHMQIILTTHSPYVVDQFRPDEVSLCHKGEDGSVVVHQLSKSQTVKEQIDVFTLGEIWTAEGDKALAETSLPAVEAGK